MLTNTDQKTPSSIYKTKKNEMKLKKEKKFVEKISKKLLLSVIEFSQPN